MIEIRNLSYRYPDQTALALDDVSMTIERGEFVLVTGASGAGKSTWLRCLNGLVPYFTGGNISGSVMVAGHDMIAVGPQVLSRHVGFVLQTPEAQAILDEVEAELAFALEQAGVSSAEIETRITTILDQLDITHLRHRLIRELSGGERQRVAIASVLVLQPSILVLDEPTSQLDGESAETLLNLLITLNQQHNLTIILSEHRLDRIRPYATRELIFADSQLVADESVIRNPLSVIRKPSIPQSPNPSIPQSPFLRLTNLTHSYGDNRIFTDFSMQLGRGEIVGLLGRNGSGKTTLLKSIVGLVQPQSGELTLDGMPIHDQPVAVRCRRIAYLPQNPDDLLFAETVREELTITLRNHNLPLDDEAIDKLLETLGLQAYSASYPRDLSVGQRQRVALAAVLITDPDIILLDEPTRGLDDALKQLFGEVLQVWQKQGKAILIATHDVGWIGRIADRTVTLASVPHKNFRIGTNHIKVDIR